MKFEEFKMKLRDDLPGVLPEGMQNVIIDFKYAEKLQDHSYNGMVVRPEGQATGLSIDIDRFYNAYMNGTTYEECLHVAGAVVSENLLKMPEYNMSQFNNYESVKDYLSIQVVSTELSKDMLEKIPHKEIEDLSIVYRLVIHSDQNSSQSILITNNMLEGYGISAEQLHADAIKIAPEFQPAEVRSMVDVIGDMMGDEFQGDTELLDINMYVASNPNRNMGAGIIAYPDFMEQAAEMLNGDFYVLPSSIHEVLLIVDNGEMCTSELEKMVREVNETMLSPEERLSDYVYHYDRKEKKFELARKYDERQAGREQEKHNSTLEKLKDKKRECTERPKKEQQEAKRHCESVATI